MKYGKKWNLITTKKRRSFETEEDFGRKVREGQQEMGKGGDK